MAQDLEIELATYRQHLPELLASEGRFVLMINGEVISGPFDSFEAALEAGYERYGPVAFLVKQIRRSEPIHCVFTYDGPAGTFRLTWGGGTAPSP